MRSLRNNWFLLVPLFSAASWTFAATPPPASSNPATEALLTEVEQASVRYFYDYGHPTSGLTRVDTQRPENYCEIGGTGWGCFNLIVAAERGFVPRSDIAARAQRLVHFLAEKADRFHGAFPHWMDGETGKTIAFDRLKQDDGADLVETAFLAEGLIALREYFTHDDPVESDIRATADRLWRDIDWTWFAQEQNGRSVLIWHWSPTVGWKKNMAVQGFNETFMIYLLAICSPTHPVPAKFFWQGWAGGGERFSTPRVDFGIPMTVGRSMSMPLFFAHYSFLGFDPHAVSFGGRTYFDHLRDMCRVQVAYAKSKADTFKGYDTYWGLTSCRGPKGYKPYAPGPRDDGTIASTAALSSMPYVPEESLAFLAALDKHRDKLWGKFGPADAFNPTQDWVASGYLGNDIGTIAPMIENYRTGLCWKTFMHAPEIQHAVQLIQESEPKAQTITANR